MDSPPDEPLQYPHRQGVTELPIQLIPIIHQRPLVARINIDGDVVPAQPGYEYGVTLRTLSPGTDPSYNLHILSFVADIQLRKPKPFVDVILDYNCTAPDFLDR